MLAHLLILLIPSNSEAELYFYVYERPWFWSDKRNVQISKTPYGNKIVYKYYFCDIWPYFSIFVYY